MWLFLQMVWDKLDAKFWTRQKELAIRLAQQKLEEFMRRHLRVGGSSEDHSGGGAGCFHGPAEAGGVHEAAPEGGWVDGSSEEHQGVGAFMRVGGREAVWSIRG